MSDQAKKARAPKGQARKCPRTGCGQKVGSGYCRSCQRTAANHGVTPAELPPVGELAREGSGGVPASVSGARGGSARTEAKFEAARGNIAKAHAARRATYKQLATLTPEGLAMAASLAKTPAAVRLYLGRIKRRDLTLTPRQAEALAQAEEQIRQARAQRRARKARA